MSKAATSILKYCVDQIHKQLIDWRRNHAGIIENLDDLHTVRHHQVVCLQLAHLVREFEGTDNSDEHVHHEQYPKLQSDYKSDVIALVGAFEYLGNPFWETSRKPLDLDQLIVTPPDVIDNVNVRKVKYIGFSYTQHFQQASQLSGRDVHC